MKWNPVVEKMELKTLLQILQRSVQLALPFMSLLFPGLAVDTSLAIAFCIKYSRRLHPKPKKKKEQVVVGREREREEARRHPFPPLLGPFRGGGRSPAQPPPSVPSTCPPGLLLGQGPQQAQAGRNPATVPHPRPQKSTAEGERAAAGTSRVTFPPAQSTAHRSPSLCWGSPSLPATCFGRLTRASRLAASPRPQRGGLRTRALSSGRPRARDRGGEQALGSGKHTWRRGGGWVANTKIEIICRGTPAGFRARSFPPIPAGSLLPPAPGRPLPAEGSAQRARGRPEGAGSVEGTPGHGPRWRRRSYLVRGASSLWSGGLTAVLLSTAAE